MRWNRLDDLTEDLRNGFRQIAWNPGFTAVAVLTLALGIGANTALFSIFNSLILRPLPVRDPGSLALLTDGSWSYPIWNEIATRETELFDGALAWSAQRFDLSAGGPTDPVDGAFASGRFFGGALKRSLVIERASWADIAWNCQWLKRLRSLPLSWKSGFLGRKMALARPWKVRLTPA